MIPSPEELEKLWAAQRAAGQQARMMADEGVTPEAGHFYTVSKDFSRGDASWSECFWEVLAICGAKAFVRIHQNYGEPIERFWEIQNRAWYLADDAWLIKSEASQ